MDLSVQKRRAAFRSVFLQQAARLSYQGLGTTAGASTEYRLSVVLCTVVAT